MDLVRATGLLVLAFAFAAPPSQADVCEDYAKIVDVYIADVRKSALTLNAATNASQVGVAAEAFAAAHETLHEKLRELQPEMAQQPSGATRSKDCERVKAKMADFSDELDGVNERLQASIKKYANDDRVRQAANRLRAFEKTENEPTVLGKEAEPALTPR